MLEVARQKLRDQRLEARVEMICADAMTLPYESDSMDGIFMSFTLELFDLPEIPAVLAECRRTEDGAKMVAVRVDTKPDEAIP